MVKLFKYIFFAPWDLKMWMVFLIAFPFYVFDPGQPQPADYFMAGFIFLKIVLNQFKIPFRRLKIIRLFFYLIFYIGLVNFILYLFYIGHYFDGLPFYIITSFYVYNCLVVLLAFNLYNKYGYKFLEICLFGIVISVVTQISLSQYGDIYWGVRDMFFFKNPNQLGYYSLLSLCIYLILQRKVQVWAPITFVVFITCFYMAFTSLSMAAMYSIVLVVPVFLLEKGILSGKGILYLIIISLGGLFILTNTQRGNLLMERMAYRFEEKSSRYSPEVTFELERGYDRLKEHPEYLILGAGEGGYDRFRKTSFIGGHEIHSSFGTIIFSYGIPGTILFSLLIYQSLKRHSIYSLLYAVPIFAYGFAHMGLRFTLFWIAMAILYLVKVYEDRKRTTNNIKYIRSSIVSIGENE